MTDTEDRHTTITENNDGCKRTLNPPPDTPEAKEALGPLQQLVGTWANIHPDFREADKKGKLSDFIGPQSPLNGRGWNLIALPFAAPENSRNYRLLMNQYNEVLNFKFVDDDVPNRGITNDDPPKPGDQLVAALDYEQVIKQISADDEPKSGLAGCSDLPIHHEPGMFLHMKEQQIDGINIARLATIPHGNAANAIGRWDSRSDKFDGPPNIEPENGFPVGITDDIKEAVRNSSDPDSYLFPYFHYTNNPFKGVVNATGFPGFSPADANALLRGGLPNNIVKTTELAFDTDTLEAGIVNIPFIERQADASFMKSTFWIMETDEPGINDEPKLLLAYSQFIMLDFFDRVDGEEGLIRWPHISINLMEKIA